ncbi:lipoprotein releasing system permease LolE [Leptospira ryugenii]|uniref:Lipoprotein releasing system permease LolE n=1 Tax=Leptospira ryugenii TaxID=1917863 RepID=A0A2P2E1B6_9LEPT|nr:FtsX-like permease family protein [Leptospira ryugenii]GBF50687.1 lipoprotein releasing system permease LolE [Leptospira ryugenii]
MYFLAIRQILSRPQQTILTILGILLGTAGYVMFSGMMLGFQQVIMEQLVNSDGQIKISPKDEVISAKTFEDVFFEGKEIRWITPPVGRTDNTRLTNIMGWMERLDNDPRVVGYAPQLSREIIFLNGKASSPARLIGIDPNKQTKVTNLETYIFECKIKDLSRGGASVILGSGILTKLGGKVGDSIQVLSPKGKISPIKIIGELKTGNRLVDDVSSYASLSTVQNLTQSGGEVSQLLVKIQNLREASYIAEDWTFISKDKVESWDQANESILSVFKTQDIVRNSTTFTIILVVAFGIYNILNMVVNQKKREIAILRSIGFNGKDTIMLFLIQGVLLGLLGGILGLLLGAFGCYMIEGIPLGNSKGETKAVLRTMVISWDVLIYLKAFCISMLSATVASYIPARLASKLSPVEIIRGTI